MGNDAALNELLSLWEREQAHGHDVPAAELCRDRPELAAELEARIRAVRHLNGLHREADQTVSCLSDDTRPEDPAPGSFRPAVPGYEVLGVLGRGGMGVVYKARQRGLNRLVALKMILVGGHAGPAELARFRAEAEAIARLQHPNIVQIHEVGEHEGGPFFSLEFCPGGSLERKLAGTPLPPEEGAALVETLARAMQAAHDKGIIHRDLKPGNVLLAEDGTPKVTDFGLAKRLGEAGQTTTGAVMGTPPYMAPEQTGGSKGPTGPAVDVYALGAILYECLTGRPPFKAATTMDTLMQVLSDEPVPPRQLQPRTPRDLETVCLKCLQKEPTRRYASAQELAEDLSRFLKAEPVRARPVTVADRAIKWVRRRPALATAYGLLALALLLGGLGGGATWLWQRAEEARAQLAREKERSDELSYLRQVGLAQREWQEGNVSRAEELLQGCPEEKRGWEWRYVRRLCHSDLCTFRGHTDSLSGVAFSPDGTRLASASADGSARVWDAATGREVLHLRGHGSGLVHPTFSPDGTHIACPSPDGTAIVWDARTGEEIYTLTGHTAAVKRVAFSPDGRRLASASQDGTARLWDVRTGREECVFRGHVKYLAGVAFSPDGRSLAACGEDPWREDGEVTVWDTGTHKEVRSLRSPYRVTAITYSPDGRQLACSCADEAVRVWESETGREVYSLWGHAGQVFGVAFSPDGTRLASGGSDQVVRAWDLATRREVFSFRGHSDAVVGVAFSPDGRRLASASRDRTVKLWAVAESQPAVALRGGAGAVWGVAFSPDGRRLASATQEGIVQVWDVAAGALAHSAQAHEKTAGAVAFSQDREALVSGGGDGLVKVWDAKTGAPRAVLPRSAAGIQGLALSPDGRLLASASATWDPTTKFGYVGVQVRVWDLQAGAELFSEAVPGVNCVAFSPDGRRLACGGEEVTVREASTGQLVLSLRGHSDVVQAVAFSPDGRRVASASRDRTVRVWDAADGRPLLTLEGHTGGVTSVAFSPDGRRVASGCDDRTVRLFSADSGEETLALRAGLGPVHCLAFTPDGHRLASGGWDGVVRVWDARPVEISRDPGDLRSPTDSTGLAR
jgi:WD40 repeat protein